MMDWNKFNSCYRTAAKNNPTKPQITFYETDFQREIREAQELSDSEECVEYEEPPQRRSILSFTFSFLLRW